MWNDSMIRSFLAVGETGNITQAAQSRFLTQQAISKQIARLEEELGCTLFIRSRGGAAITPAGEIYLNAFRQMLSTLDEAKEKACAAIQADLQIVRVAYLEMLSLDTSWKPFIRDFRRRHPEIRVDIRTYPEAEIYHALDTGDVDACISFGISNVPIVTPHFDLTLEHNKMYLCIHRDYPGAAEAKSYRDFRNVKLFFPRTSPEPAEGRAASIGFPKSCIRYRDTLSNAILSVNLLEGGIMMPLNSDVRGDDMITFPIDDVTSRTAFFWPQENNSPALSVLVSELTDYMKAHPVAE